MMLEILRRLKRDERGAVLVYFTVGSVILMGVLALSTDLGRLFTLGTELQHHADAACIAGVVELDGRIGSRNRATVAASIFVIQILILVWVYKDAKAKGVENPVLWLILVLLFPLIGLIVYLIVRPKGTPSGGAGGAEGTEGS